MTESKAHNAFVNKILRFEDDIEFMDIVCRYISRSEISEGGRIFTCFSPDSHPNILRYKASQDNRERISAHCKKTLYSSYIKDIYEEVQIYLQSVLKEAAENTKARPESLLGDLSGMTMSFRDILAFNKDGTIIDKVTERMFQKLDSKKNIEDLISAICKRLGLDIQADIIKEAVYYLEIRHKLVHADGFADADFRERHPGLVYTDDSYIDLSYDLIVAVREKVSALISAIDSAALSKNILNPHT